MGVVGVGVVIADFCCEQPEIARPSNAVSAKVEFRTTGFILRIITYVGVLSKTDVLAGSREPFN